MFEELEQMMREMEEDEAQVQGHPCCANCLYCQAEKPGHHICTNSAHLRGERFSEEDEYDLVNIGCVRWRSDVTGMPYEKGE